MRRGSQRNDGLRAGRVRAAIKATLLRAADIIGKITQDDVTELQALLLAHGNTLEQVARVDRAMVAVARLRAMAKKGRT